MYATRLHSANFSGSTSDKGSPGSRETGRLAQTYTCYCGNLDLLIQADVAQVSANAREEQKKKMFDAGADSYLTKPFQLPELVAKLKEQEK